MKRRDGTELMTLGLVIIIIFLISKSLLFKIFAGKGYLHVVIKIHDRDVHFFDVHLDAHWKEAREEQLKELEKDLPKDEDCRIIVAGDYNINSGYNIRGRRNKYK